MMQSHSSALAPVYSAVPPWVEEKRNALFFLTSTILVEVL